jgi:hypothetical protein
MSVNRQKIGASVANYFEDFSDVLGKKIRRNSGIFKVFCNKL